MAEDEPPSPLCFKTPEESLLYYSRSGDYRAVAEILNLYVEENAIDINCKGEQKSNHGWTPLHLACYFGHESIVELLIKHGSDINVVNDTGDTPLHKASYTGREELVLLLLSKNADVFIRNSENQAAKDVAKNSDIKKLLQAAEDADIQRKNSLLLNAAREGDTQLIDELLKSDHPPNINSVDSLGNSALHCAAYRGRKEAAVLLLENGINASIKNARGQYAVDLAANASMKQILNVQPVKHFQKTASRFEGLLLRKSRFLGWKEVWTVLDKGVMSFFNSRADSTTGTKRKGYKYLDGARVDLDVCDTAVFTITYSDNTRQRFSVPPLSEQQVDRQKWENAVIEHVEFSSHYLKQGFSDSDPDDEEEGDVMPVGTIQDKFQTAQAHVQLFEKYVKSLKSKVEEVDNGRRTDAVDCCKGMASDLEIMLQCANKASSSLSHCLTVFIQQEEVRSLEMKQQQERCRFLQDALHALAQEHHEMEKSFVSPYHSSPNFPHYEDTDCDEFFDAFEGKSPPDDKSLSENSISSSNTLVQSETDVFCSFSSNLSDFMKTPTLSKWGRASLPVPQFSRNDFSVWSILKQCIGKELSKITMPIVFNEPLSLLQRLTENVEYSYLLEKANNSEDPVNRMEYVAAFAVAAISSNWERLGKPFNPLLGETFELYREEDDIRIVTEQVSHHPPVSAFHVDSPHFIFSGAIHPKLKLWARSVEIKPEGTVILRLKKHNETYTWSGVTSCVHNIIVGKLWMEQCGIMEISCHTNGLVAELNFKPAGWYSKDLNCVEGFILDRQKTRLRFIYGKWCSFLKSSEVQYYDDYVLLKDQKSQGTTISKTQKKISSTGFDAGDKMECFNSINDLPCVLLWEADPRPEQSSDYYNFTFFAISLNELSASVAKSLPPTDSRLRPDIRKLEEGDVDGAAFEKNRLEEKQREARKFRKKERITWDPVWFEHGSHPYAKEECWTYKGGYWERHFSKCPDIF